MCTCTPQTHIEEYKGRGATVASDVTGHRGPKNAIKLTYLGINIKVITSFTTVFTNIKKITSFTKIVVKVGNHKYMKLVKNRPECV